MKTYKRADILPALLRPGMYTGEQGDRTEQQYLADAVVEYLNASQRILRYPNEGLKEPVRPFDRSFSWLKMMTKNDGVHDGSDSNKDD